MAFITAYNQTNIFPLESLPPVILGNSSVGGLIQQNLDLVADLMHLTSVGYQSQSYTTSRFSDTTYVMDLPSYQIYAFGQNATSGSVINQINFKNTTTGDILNVFGTFNYGGLPFLTSITSGQIEYITASTFVGDVESASGADGMLVFGSDGSFVGALTDCYEMIYNDTTKDRVATTFLVDVEARIDATNLSTTTLSDGVVSYFYSEFTTLGDPMTYHDYVLAEGLNVEIGTEINEWQLNSGDDTYFLSGLGSIVQSGDGADNVYLQSLGNLLDGGAGLDTAHIYGSSTDFELLPSYSAQGPIITISHQDGSDTYENVERLEFYDGNVALDVGHGENAGMAYRIYQAAFDRTPDESGLGFWIDALDQGYTLEQVATAVMTSPEFAQVYGADSSNRTFVDLLYQHVLHRTADDEGFNFWNDALNAGYSRGAVLAVYTECPETIALTAEVVANGIFYQPWVA